MLLGEVRAPLGIDCFDVPVGVAIAICLKSSFPFSSLARMSPVESTNLYVSSSYGASVDLGGMNNSIAPACALRA